MIWLLCALVLGADRSAPPPVVPAELLDLDPIAWHDMESVRVGHVKLPGARKVRVEAILHRGALELDGRQSDAAWLTGWLQDSATGELTTDELEVVEDRWDISVSSSGVGLRRLTVTLEAPLEHLDQGLDLLQQVIRDPSYPASELREYQRQQTRTFTVSGPTRLSFVASSAMKFGWYQQGSGYAERPDLSELARVKRRDLFTRHQELLDTAPVSVLVVGDLDAEQALAKLGPVFDGLGRPGEEGPLPPWEAREGRRVIAVHVPGEQAYVGVRTAAPTLDDDGRAAFEAVAWALGGPFNSRLNTVLREERGLTYGASAGFYPGHTHGTFTAEVEVDGEDVGEAVAVIREQLGLVVRDGVTERELAGVHRERVADWNTTRETAWSAHSFYSRLIARHETVASVRAQTAHIGALAPEATRVAAERWLGDDRAALWVIVGDREVLEPQLADLGEDVRWLDAAQVVLGSWSPW